MANPIFPHEPKKATPLYPHIPKSPKYIRLWFAVEAILDDALRSYRMLTEGERHVIAGEVADEVEKRAQGLAWLELLDGTTFDRVGEAPEHLGQSVYSAVEGFLSLAPHAKILNLSYNERVAMAEKVNTKLVDADVIVLNSGVHFRRGFTSK